MTITRRHLMPNCMQRVVFYTDHFSLFFVCIRVFVFCNFQLFTSKHRIRVFASSLSGNRNVYSPPACISVMLNVGNKSHVQYTHYHKLNNACQSQFIVRFYTYSNNSARCIVIDDITTTRGSQLLDTKRHNLAF